MADRLEQLTWDLYERLLKEVNDQVIKPQLARKILAQMFDFRPHAWRVIGITERALDEFEKFNFDSRPSGIRLERAHLHHRRDTVDDLFGPSRNRKIDSYPELDSVWKAGDSTILCVSGENAIIGNATRNPAKDALPKCYPIENDDGRLFSARTVGSAFHKEVEGKYLKDLARRVKNREVPPMSLG